MANRWDSREIPPVSHTSQEGNRRRYASLAHGPAGPLAMRAALKLCLDKPTFDLLSCCTCGSCSSRGGGRLTRANWPGSALVVRPSRVGSGAGGCRAAVFLSRCGVLAQMGCYIAAGSGTDAARQDGCGSARGTLLATGDLVSTDSTGMPTARQSARSAHPFDGAGVSAASTPTSRACGAQSCARSGGVADHALSRTAS